MLYKFKFDRLKLIPSWRDGLLGAIKNERGVHTICYVKEELKEHSTYFKQGKYYIYDSFSMWILIG